MNQDHMQRLFTAARQQADRQPPADFADTVMRLVRHEPIAPPVPATVFSQLNQLFPRAALAAATVIVLCVALDLVMPANPDADADLTAVQLYFTLEEL